MKILLDIQGRKQYAMQVTVPAVEIDARLHGHAGWKKGEIIH